MRRRKSVHGGKLNLFSAFPQRIIVGFQRGKRRGERLAAAKDGVMAGLDPAIHGLRRDK
jgi:hypothetical protein